MDNKQMKLNYMYWICGTNDCDFYNDLYHDALRCSDIWHIIACDEYGPSDWYKNKNPHWNDKVSLPSGIAPKHPKEVISDMHYNIKRHMDTAIKKITGDVPNYQQFALEIVPRANGYPAVLNASCGINAYMKSKHGMTVARVKKHVKPWHIKKDKVHFSVSGYQMVLDRGIGPMLDVYYEKVRIPKQVRTQQSVPLTRNGRKRAAKRAKLMAKKAVQSGE